MNVLIDAQISPAVAPWLIQRFAIAARHVFHTGLIDSSDASIFAFAQAHAIDALLTKDEDFCRLVQRLGAPPGILWLTCGNTSNTRLPQILDRAIPQALELLVLGDTIVEIADVGF